MSQNCECTKASIEVPVRGLKIALDEEALSGLGNNCSCVGYSLEEQWTGKYWVDGKKIYQKTVDCGTLPKATSKEVLHGISNVDFIVNLQDAAKSSTYQIHLPHVDHTGKIWSVNTYVRGASVVFLTWEDCSAYTKTFVTLFYTCTDR